MGRFLPENVSNQADGTAARNSLADSRYITRNIPYSSYTGPIIATTAAKIYSDSGSPHGGKEKKRDCASRIGTLRTRQLFNLISLPMRF